jgi:hypothetical protein
MDDADRSTAYAELLSTLLALRSDPATARFDAELAAAEAAGALEGTTARTLQWWQRESLRGVAEHLAAVLPDLLSRLAAADVAARASVEASASSWSTAVAATAGAPLVAGTSAPLSGPPPGPASGPHLWPVQDLAPSAPTGPLGSPTTPLEPTTPLRPGFVPGPPSAAGPGAVAAKAAALDDPAGSGTTGPAHPGAPSRRLLVAGINVLGEPVRAAPPAVTTEGTAPGDTDATGPAHDR